ncbi:unnamed protein product, partial [marine sediment metagenome]
MKHKWKISILIVFALLIGVVWATPISQENVNARLGAFTGPEAGTAQDDTIKASLDLLHDRLNAATGAGAGTTFYVDSGTAGTGGLTQATAVAAIQTAVNLGTDNAGDVIYVMPGHAENSASAAAIDFDCPGMTVRGWGSGEEMPIISLTAVDSTVAITANDVMLYNLQFKGNYTNGVTKCL